MEKVVEGQVYKLMKETLESAVFQLDSITLDPEIKPEEKTRKINELVGEFKTFWEKNYKAIEERFEPELANQVPRKLLHDYISEMPVKDVIEVGSLTYLLEIIAPGVEYNKLRNEILEEYGFIIVLK